MTAAVGLVLLLARTGWADHGGPGTRDAGGIGLGWLFVVGLLIVLGLAAWALLAPAPDDEESRSGEPGPRSR